MACVGSLDRIESQRLPDAPHNQRRVFPFMNLIECGISRARCLLGLPKVGGETESVPDFLKKRLPDNFHLPGKPEQMNPEIFTAVSAGKKECMEKLRSMYGTQIACLESDQGDSVLHLAAAWGNLELVKTIVSEFPSLLLKSNSKDQLPLHVAAYAGHFTVVKALVDTITYFSAKSSNDEERGRLNLYVVKDIDGDTPLHLALKGSYMRIAACLVKANQGSSFLANKDEISPLYMAVGEAKSISLVKAMLNNLDIDGLKLQLEGKKCLVHAALKARNTDILDVLLEQYPSLEEERDEKGMTCLSFGASIGFYRGVRKLLEGKPESVYVCNDDGSFPIHTAVEKRHILIVSEILRRFPDSKYLLNKKGQNILHIAANGMESGYILSYLRVRSIPSSLRGRGWMNRLMEKQDVDGNTPLHLATINWRPRTIFFLLQFYKGKCLKIRNRTPRDDIAESKQGSTALDIAESKQGSTALDIAESNLQSNYIFRERVTLLVLLYFYVTPLAIKRMFKKKMTKGSIPQTGDKSREYVNTLLVVAALVATVTFAAGFTIPGGFHSSAPNLGMPILVNDPKLIYFMVFDILAMHCSILTIATLIWAQLGDPTLVQRSLSVALPSLFCALLCMLVAFYCGILAAFVHVQGLRIFLCVTFSIFLFLMLFLLGPHVILQIPGIPAFFGPYFLLFVLLVDESSQQQASSSNDSVSNNTST